MYATSFSSTAAGTPNITSGNDINLNAVGAIHANAPLRLKSYSATTLPEDISAGSLAFQTDRRPSGSPMFHNGTFWQQLSNAGVLFNVTDYGADPTLTDSTNAIAINAAIDAAAEAGGGIVFVPAGNWTLTNQIILKFGVTLQGVGYNIIQLADDLSISGTIFNITWGSGVGSAEDASMAAFIMNSGSTICDLAIKYPNQSTTSFTPTEYGATIKLYLDAASGDKIWQWDNTVRNVFLHKCWCGIDARGSTARSTISLDSKNNPIYSLIGSCRFDQIKMSAIRYGIRADYQADWCYYDRIELQPGWLSVYYGVGSSLRDYVQKNCVFFEFSNRMDWVKITECTSWAINIAIQLINCPGPFTVTSCEFDACRTAVVDTQGNCGETHIRLIGCTFVVFDALANEAGVNKYSGYVVNVNPGSQVRGIHISDCYAFGPTKGWVYNNGTLVDRLILVNCQTWATNVVGGSGYAITAGSGMSNVIVTNNIFNGLSGTITGTASGTVRNANNI